MIKRDTPIVDILRHYPESQAIFKRHGMNCSTCMGAHLEVIESGAKTHQINIDVLLKELNACERLQNK
jgi:hybrid cluster-associated redox disulfide protein